MYKWRGPGLTCFLSLLHCPLNHDPPLALNCISWVYVYIQESALFSPSSLPRRMLGVADEAYITGSLSLYMFNFVEVVLYSPS